MNSFLYALTHRQLFVKLFHFSCDKRDIYITFPFRLSVQFTNSLEVGSVHKLYVNVTLRRKGRYLRGNRSLGCGSCINISNSEDLPK